MPPKSAVEAALTAAPGPPTPPPVVIRCDRCARPLLNYDASRPQRCSLCEKLIDDWRNATSWNELLTFNRQFIRGIRHSTIYARWGTNIDNALNPFLLRLHDYGLLVTFGQPERHKVGQETSGRFMGQWYEIKDRANITFVLPTNHPKIDKDKVNSLIERLLDMKELEVVSYFEHCDYPPGTGTMSEGRYTVNPTGTTHKEEPYAKFYSTVGPSNAGRTTQKYRAADTKEGLMWKAWKKCEANELEVITEKDLPKNSKGARSFGSRITMTLAMRPVVITVATRNWPPTMVALARTLETVAIDAGLEPVFVEEPDEDKKVDAAATSVEPEKPKEAQTAELPIRPKMVAKPHESKQKKEKRKTAYEEMKEAQSKPIQKLEDEVEALVIKDDAKT